MIPFWQKCLVFLLAASFLYYYAVTQSRYLRMPVAKGHACPPINSPSNSNVTKVLPRILMWTKYFMKWSETLDDTRIGEDFVGNCAAKCLITNDPCLIEDSDAVVFHMRNMKLTQLPSKRLTWQKWVFFLMESPPHTGFADFNFTYGMFNWTMTYRRDSDVYLPYGRITPRLLTNATRAKRDLKTLWKSKRKTAVWIVSNCVTSGRRERFVAELRRHVDVDVYGFCGNYKCPWSRNDFCYRYFERSYFFVLAFENSICDDYVSEKFFNALRHDIVPVVFGGANYSDVAPPHSYIDALSFESPRHLAEYLVKLSRNYAQYAAYFTWKKRYDVDIWPGGFCELCKKLHNNVDRQETSLYEDVRSWWFGEGRCRSWRLVQFTPSTRAHDFIHRGWLQRASTPNPSASKRDLPA